jgi:hypothetical protein
MVLLALSQFVNTGIISMITGIVAGAIVSVIKTGKKRKK